jgi:hypothetical protein
LLARNIRWPLLPRSNFPAPARPQVDVLLDGSTSPSEDCGAANVHMVHRQSQMMQLRWPISGAARPCTSRAGRRLAEKKKAEKKS